MSLDLCSSHLLWSHLLLLLLSKHVLLEKSVSLVCLSLEIVHISDKLEWVNNLLVVKKHASNLACALTVVLRDDWVNSITNLLSASIWLSNRSESCKINKSRLLLLLLLLVHHGLLLLRCHVLLRRHHHWMWHGLLLHILSWHLTLWSLILDLFIETTSLVLVGFASAGLASSALIVLLISALASFTLVSTLSVSTSVLVLAL